jgi:hypothetical protein
VLEAYIELLVLLLGAKLDVLEELLDIRLDELAKKLLEEVSRVHTAAAAWQWSTSHSH